MRSRKVPSGEGASDVVGGVRSLSSLGLVVGLVALALWGVSGRAEADLGCIWVDGCDSVALVDGDARFHVDPSPSGWATIVTFGNPGDVPIFGDWDCDGEATPGMYRPSDGYVYLRNSNVSGVADLAFFFGDPSDIPLAGDFDGDGCDTIAVYRSIEGTVYVSNSLRRGAADYSFTFGNPGDKPFVGDFNGDGIDTVGLHRESTGFVYFRNSNTSGVADEHFFYGDPGDQLIAGDWDGDGDDTVAVYRPTTSTLYIKNSNEVGVADAELVVGNFEHVLVLDRAFGAGNRCEQNEATKCSSPTTTVPPSSTTTTTTVPSSPPGFDVEVFPGDDVQALVDAHPSGTVFYLRAGRYPRVTIMAKSGQTFVGEPGAVLDGENVASYGFVEGGNEVTVRGLVVRDYTDTCIEWGANGAGRDWLIEDVEVSGCVTGVRVKDGSTLRDSFIHDNSGKGLVVRNGSYVIDGNEFAFNGKGMYLQRTTDTLVRGNYVHHNRGTGIHVDDSNINILIENNDLIGNTFGINYEISFRGVIRYNRVEDNGLNNERYTHDGSGIAILISKDVEVYGNTVKNNRNAILGVYSDNRGSSAVTGEVFQLRNLHVHHNTISMDQGLSGIADYSDPVDGPSYGSSWNNQFDNNTYTLTPANGKFFRWKDPVASTLINEHYTLTEWQTTVFPNDG